MGNQHHNAGKLEKWMTIWSVFLHNVHAGAFFEVSFGVTRGSLLGRSLADKNMIDLLISSAWVMELPVDSTSISSSWERQNMAEKRLARASQNQGM